MLISVGIDVGAKNGAISVIDENFNILYLNKAPYIEVDMAHTSKNRVKPKLNKETGKYEITYKKRSWTDYTKLRSIFEPFVCRKYQIVYTIERVTVRPDEGELSSFIFGNSMGCFQGLSTYLQPISIYEPTPQVWKKELGVNSDKATSVKLAEDIFNTNLKTYLKKGKVDDLAEALLLAVYGFKQYSENSK